MAINADDIKRICEAISNDDEVPQKNHDNEERSERSLKIEWGFLFLITIELGMDVKKAKRIKEKLKIRLIKDGEALNTILIDWISRKGSKATWDKLTSVFASETLNFPAIAMKDYVRILQDLRSSYSMTKVLQNDLLRTEIFKRLPFHGKRNFRLVCRHWWGISLPDWRRMVSLKIGSIFGSITMSEFFNLFSKNSTGDWTEDVFRLVDYPYQSYTFYDLKILPPNQEWKNYDKFFWTFCAPKASNLYIQYSHFYFSGVLETLKWIAINACPKLRRLEILECKNSIPDCPKRIRTEFAVGECAKNLLNFRCEQPTLLEETIQFLQLAPNVQNLAVENLNVLQGLLNLNNVRLKLKSLKLYTKGVIPSEDFQKLIEYVKRFPKSIKNLEICNDSLYRSMRAPPFEFHSIISQCSQLTTLSLNFVKTLESDGNPRWLMDLSTIPLPYLKRLKIDFGKNNFYYDRIWWNQNLAADDRRMKFDFGTLKNTPKLESLFIIYSSLPNVIIREMGTRDWIYEGPRDIFTPEDRQSSAIRYSAESPIYLEHLRDFHFDGWKMKEEDLQLFKNWFPNLKRLTTALNHKALKEALKIFPSLECLYMTSRSEYGYQDVLGNAEELMNLEKIRVFLDLPNVGQFEAKKGEHDSKVCLNPCRWKL